MLFHTKIKWLRFQLHIYLVCLKQNQTHRCFMTPSVSRRFWLGMPYNTIWGSNSACLIVVSTNTFSLSTLWHRSCAAPICLTLWPVSVSCPWYSSHLLHSLLLLLLFLLCIEIHVMLCKSTCATLLCRRVAYRQCGVALTDAWTNPSKQPRIKYFLPFSLTQGGLYSIFQQDKPQRSHPYLFLSCCKIQPNIFHFPPTSFNKGSGDSHLAQMDTHAETRQKNCPTARLVPYSSYLWGPIPRLDLMAVI